MTEPRPISATRDVDVSPYDHLFAAAREKLVRICVGFVGADAAEDVVSWTSQELVFDGGEWVFSLYLTDTDRESEIVGAIVARLSAQTGVINSVELVQGARPPGS